MYVKARRAIPGSAFQLGHFAPTQPSNDSPFCVSFPHAFSPTGMSRTFRRKKIEAKKNKVFSAVWSR
jgi:hypothetical protein